MGDPSIFGFISGGISIACLVVSAFFLRFWLRTRDRLFLAFSLAFLLLAVNQTLPVVLGQPSESYPQVYLLRLAAFALIILAIASKNRGRKDL